MTRKAIIHNRRFWWQYADGRRERIYANERIKGHLAYSNSAAARAVEEAEAPPRRTNHPPRPPGTGPTLPAADRDIGDKTLTELAFDHGWGSVARCTEALKQHRPAIWEQARANARERTNANLMTPTYKEKQP
jgi:hypothetical protein